MACRLVSAKALPEPMLPYCQLDSWEQISVKFESEFYHFHSRKCIWICRLPRWQPFCPGGDKLTHWCLLTPYGTWSLDMDNTGSGNGLSHVRCQFIVNWMPKDWIQWNMNQNNFLLRKCIWRSLPNVDHFLWLQRIPPRVRENQFYMSYSSLYSSACYQIRIKWACSWYIWSIYKDKIKSC